MSVMTIDCPTNRNEADAVARHFERRGGGGEFNMEVEWILSQVAPAAQAVLDVGCGNGALLQRLGLSRSLGLDVCASGLSLTRRRLSAARLVCGRADRITFADATFDVVTAQHVIEHIRDAESALREWFRLLRPGGRLIMVTPNSRFSDATVFADPTHVCVYDEIELAELCAGAGFKVEDLRSIGLPWFRRYHGWPGGWRMRKWVMESARNLSSIAPLRWRGQSLCCVGRRP